MLLYHKSLNWQILQALLDTLPRLWWDFTQLLDRSLCRQLMMILMELLVEHLVGGELR